MIDSTSLGRDAREVAGDRVEQPGDGNEADDGDEKEERGEEREKEVVGQLGREAEAVVCQDLARRCAWRAPSRRSEPSAHRSISGPAAGCSGPCRPSASTTARRWPGTSRPTLRAPGRGDVQPARSTACAEPAARLREIAFAGQRPPREAAAEAGEQRAGDRALTKPLQRQRAAADADQPARHRQLFARAVPPAVAPRRCSAARCVVRFSSCVSVMPRHACKFGGRSSELDLLM